MLGDGEISRAYTVGVECGNGAWQRFYLFFLVTNLGRGVIGGAGQERYL